MTTESNIPESLRGVESIEDVWLTAREQIAAKLKTGVVSQSSAEFSERLIIAVKTLVEVNELSIADAVVLMSTVGLVMALGQGAIDANADKETPLGIGYAHHAIHVMAHVAGQTERYKAQGGKVTFADGRVEQGGSTKASFTDFVGSLDVPPTGELS